MTLVLAALVGFVVGAVSVFVLTREVAVRHRTPRGSTGARVHPSIRGSLDPFPAMPPSNVRLIERDGCEE